MPDDKVLRCDCGYEVMGEDEAQLVEDVRAHAREAHGIAFSREDALVVLLRSQLGSAVADRPSERRPTSRGGER
jgi:predicted small metal-binding protein